MAYFSTVATGLVFNRRQHVEAIWHSRAITAGTEPPGMALAQRYLADSSVEACVSVGHRLINFVARVARTNPDTRKDFLLSDTLRPLADDYEPFVTDARQAWLSLNADTLRTLFKATPPIHTGSITALRLLIATPAWRSLVAMRAENFHRWRKEHELVLGVDQQSGRASDVRDHDGNVRGRRVSATRRGHRIGNGSTEHTTNIAGEGIRAIATAVDSVITDTLVNLRCLTNGFVLDLDDEGNILSMGGIGV